MLRELHDLEVHALPEQGGEVCLSGMQIHPRSRSKGAQPGDIDFHAALDHAGDEPLNQRAVLGCLFDLRLDLLFAQRFAREHHQPAPAAVVVNAGNEAIPGRRHEIVRFHLGAVEDRQRLARQVDHDRGFENRRDLAEHLFTDLKRWALHRPRTRRGPRRGFQALCFPALLFLAPAALLLRFGLSAFGSARLARRTCFVSRIGGAAFALGSFRVAFARGCLGLGRGCLGLGRGCLGLGRGCLGLGRLRARLFASGLGFGLGGRGCRWLFGGFRAAGRCVAGCRLRPTRRGYAGFVRSYGIRGHWAPKPDREFSMPLVSKSVGLALSTLRLYRGPERLPIAPWLEPSKGTEACASGTALCRRSGV
jgi:hypothetical protein